MVYFIMLFGWNVLLLGCPALIAIALFCFLLWSDSRHDLRKRKRRIENKKE